MADPFVHLHVHAGYSVLGGVARVRDLLTDANRLGMPAIPIHSELEKTAERQPYHGDAPRRVDGRADARAARRPEHDLGAFALA